MKKIIAMLSALALMSSLVTMVSAAPAETSIEPIFYVEKLADKSDDGESMYELKVDYSGDELSSVKKSGKYTGTAFTMIQVEFDHPVDEGIWAESEAGTYTDLSDTLGQYLFQGGNGTYYAPASGDAILTIYTAADIDVKDFVINKALCTVDTFEKNVTSIQTNYSARQADVDNGVAHYLAYIGAKGGDDDNDDEEKAATMDTPVAGNDMYGMKTALTKITFNNVENPVVKLEKDGVDSGKSYDLPANVKGGAAEIIGIIRYAADVKGEFVLSVFDGETKVVSTSYVAE